MRWQRLDADADVPAPGRTGWVGGVQGVVVTSLGIVTLLTLIALASLTGQTDPSLTPLRRLAGAIALVVTGVLFMMVQRVVARRPPTRRLVAVGMVVVALGTFGVWLSYTWTMIGVSAATAILLIPGRWGRVVAAAVILVAEVQVILLNPGLFTRIGILGVSVTVTFVLYTLNRLVQALTELRHSREQLARLAVDDERQRISRDLHDLLGRTLVAVSLRQQAALLLLDRDIDKARAQLTSAHETIALGQAQLRLLTRGPVTSGLAAEMETARATCERLGLDITITTPEGLLGDEALENIAARVVREAITNMLKHSRPTTCHIELEHVSDQWHLTITNNGSAAEATSDDRGTGLRELTRLVEGAGGNLAAHHTRSGGFVVEAQLPASHPHT